MRFAPEYVDNVLTQNFEDAKRLFFQHLIEIHYAHLLMLLKVGILTHPEAKAIGNALSKIRSESIQDVTFDGSFEDLFFYIEGLLDQYCGPEVAGKLHTARSRNDIDATLYRLKWRELIVETQLAALCLREVLLEISEKHHQVIFPMYTHTQAAQPSTIAHYLLGVIEHLERDHRRLDSAFSTMNSCPLGSCAITGTGFPIDRHLTSTLLGFDSPTGNTHASIAGVDYLLEAISAVQILVITLGKVVQDLLFWSSSSIRFLRLDDMFVQPSSIMPQKRNPVSLEHSRALLSRSFGEASGVFQMLHNTPFGDIVDVEDDLQPLIDSAFSDCLRSLRVLAGAMRSATFHPEQLEARGDFDWITMTELADTLVRQEQIPFRGAHAIAAMMVQKLLAEPEVSLSQALRICSRDVLGREISLADEEIRKLLLPEHFVSIRTTYGGPSPEVVKQAIKESRKTLQLDRNRLESKQARLNETRRNLRNQADRLT